MRETIRIGVMLACMLVCGLAAAQDKGTGDEEKGGFVFKTKDGSSLKCKPQAATLTVGTSYAKMDLQFAQIASIEFGAESNKTTIILLNGDRLQGTVGGDKIVVSTIIGNLTVPMDQLVSITSVIAQDKKSAEFKDTPEAKRRCMNNLRQIDSAKEQYALAYRLGDEAVVTGPQIGEYIKGGWNAMKCPAGGKYTVNAIGSDPVCSVPGHAMQ